MFRQAAQVIAAQRVAVWMRITDFVWGEIGAQRPVDLTGGGQDGKKNGPTVLTVGPWLRALGGVSPG
jgi:hypothetical protein